MFNLKKLKQNFLPPPLDKHLIINNLQKLKQLFYANKITEIIKKEQIDKLILLGDLYYHGPRNDIPVGHDAKETVKILNSLKDILNLTKEEQLEYENMKLRIENELLKKGYLMKGDGTIVKFTK